MELTHINEQGRGQMVDVSSKDVTSRVASAQAIIHMNEKTFHAISNKEIKKGDVFIIIYAPEEGVVVYKNGTKKGSIDGHDFKKALFGIWLCDKPADKDLKDEMLGK